ncbi:hypothetical protein IKP85_00805 [bacterium]|nr:hypothetical protein [bacterium]
MKYKNTRKTKEYYNIWLIISIAIVFIQVIISYFNYKIIDLFSVLSLFVFVIPVWICNFICKTIIKNSITAKNINAIINGTYILVVQVILLVLFVILFSPPY